MAAAADQLTIVWEMPTAEAHWVAGEPPADA
jgi:hypothetical protein